MYTCPDEIKHEASRSCTGDEYALVMTSVKKKGKQVNYLLEALFDVSCSDSSCFSNYAGLNFG